VTLVITDTLIAVLTYLLFLKQSFFQMINVTDPAAVHSQQVIKGIN